MDEVEEILVGEYGPTMHFAHVVEVLVYAEVQEVRSRPLEGWAVVIDRETCYRRSQLLRQAVRERPRIEKLAVGAA